MWRGQRLGGSARAVCVGLLQTCELYQEFWMVSESCLKCEVLIGCITDWPCYQGLGSSTGDLRQAPGA